ncbi:MAG: DUF4830 domain-containing protein [Oscillospiraceae bacterium]|nr:DUF4830 domain-containing protein [Oscillospiraceae bacterium]
MTCKPKDKVKTAVMLIILLIAAGVVWIFMRADKENDLDEALTMNSNSERVIFLNKAGWIVAPDPIEQEKITIPSEFNEAYNAYNEIQLQQGFDLTKSAGEEAEIFTYSVLNYPDYPENITANLIFVNDRLVGADITQTIENGFTLPLLQGNIIDLTGKFAGTSAETETETTAPAEVTESVTTTVPEETTSSPLTETASNVSSHR